MADHKQTEGERTLRNISDVEIAGRMGWRGPGAYTEASMCKIKSIIDHVLQVERAAPPPASFLPEVQVENGSAGDAAAAQAEQDAREIAAIWDSAKAEAAMYVEVHCVDGEVHAKHIMEQPRPKVAPPLPKIGIAAADVTRAQRDLVHYATSGDAGLAAACARAQVVIERLLSGLDVEQLS